MASDPNSPSQPPDPRRDLGKDFEKFARGQRPTGKARPISSGAQSRVIGGALAGAALSVVLAYIIYRSFFGNSLAHNPYAEAPRSPVVPGATQKEPEGAGSKADVPVNQGGADLTSRVMPATQPAQPRRAVNSQPSDFPDAKPVQVDSEAPKVSAIPQTLPPAQAQTQFLPQPQPQPSNAYPLLLAPTKPAATPAPVWLADAVRNVDFENISGTKATDWTVGSASVTAARLPLQLPADGHGQSVLLMRSLVANGASREAVAFQKLNTVFTPGSFTLTVDVAAAQSSEAAYRVALCDALNNRQISNATGKVDADGQWHRISVTCVVPDGAPYLKHPIMLRLSHAGYSALRRRLHWPWPASWRPREGQKASGPAAKPGKS